MTPEASSASTGAVRLATGEAVEFDIRVARLGSRVPALLLDIVVQVVLVIGLVMVVSMVLSLAAPGVRDDALLSVVLVVSLATAFIGYPTALETLAGGRTLGKLAMGLRVVREDGGPIRFRHALTRSLVGLAVEWPGLALPPLTWVASLWTMLADPQGRRLGDRAAGTMVIHERAPTTWGRVPPMPPILARWAADLDLIGLDDELALTVRHYLARNKQLREPARSQLGYALAREVAACTTPPAPPGTPGWAYLAAVLAERNRRSMLRLARARTSTALIWPELTLALTPPVAAAPPEAWSPGVGSVPPHNAPWGSRIRPATPLDTAPVPTPLR